MLAVLIVMIKKYFLVKTLPIQYQSDEPYSISNQNGSKTIRFGAAHAYIAHVREYPQDVLCEYCATELFSWSSKVAMLNGAFKVLFQTP